MSKPRKFFGFGVRPHSGGYDTDYFIGITWSNDKNIDYNFLNIHIFWICLAFHIKNKKW